MKLRYTFMELKELTKDELVKEIEFQNLLKNAIRTSLRNKQKTKQSN